ncbi:hypothetical protein LXL04_037348 [Taraxacum kok-saghyz]
MHLHVQVILEMHHKVTASVSMEFDNISPPTPVVFLVPTNTPSLPTNLNPNKLTMQQQKVSRKQRHPTLAIPQLMRLLMDEAWDSVLITHNKDFLYENEDLLPPGVTSRTFAKYSVSGVADASEKCSLYATLEANSTKETEATSDDTSTNSSANDQSTLDLGIEKKQTFRIPLKV